jgi:hypothetical protein
MDAEEAITLMTKMEKIYIFDTFPVHGAQCSKQSHSINDMVKGISSARKK